MRGLLSIIGIVGIVGVAVGVHMRNNAVTPHENITNPAVSVSPQALEPTKAIQKVLSETTSVFVPAWATATGAELADYDRVYLFSIPATEQGLQSNTADQKKLLTLSQQLPPSARWIVISMTNSDRNLDILNNTSSWKPIQDDIVALVATNQLSGVLLDFELAALSSEDLKTRVTKFYEDMNTKLGETPFAITLYGDTFYRQRPYDVQTLGKLTDEVVIMAYDFHKSRGEPGPNFPFTRGEKYPYDFHSMISDFSARIPVDKISIAYGMYGYDWLVDEKQRPIRQANALSLNEITQDFLTDCTWQNCLVRRDDQSAETEINYVDENAGYHIVWFEDEQSQQKKEAYAREQGIGGTVFWAFSYY